MSGKPKFVELENVRVAYDRKSGNVVITSQDSRLESGFIITPKRNSPVEDSLMRLLGGAGVDTRPRKQERFDAVGYILDSKSRSYMIGGSYDSPRMKLARDIAYEGERRGIPSLVLSPAVGTTTLALLTAAKDFRDRNMHKRDSTQIIVRDFEALNRWRKAQKENEGSGIRDRIAYERGLRQQMELQHVIEQIRTARGTKCIGVTVGITYGDEESMNVISFAPVSDDSLKATALSLRVGLGRLTSTFERLGSNEYVLYAEGDLRVGSVL